MSDSATKNKTYTIEVLDGHLKSLKFNVISGTRIGRTKGEILLPDSKVSALHAQFDTDKEGNLILKDLKSSNGIKYKGKMIRRLALINGSIFQLGRIRLRIHITEAGAEEKRSFKSKKEDLANYLERIQIDGAPSPYMLVAFNPIILLHFLEGPHADQTIPLGYGPREVGRDSLDINLEDGKAPDLAFVLKPPIDPGNRPIIENKSIDAVVLNSRPFNTAEIYDGDLIKVGRSLIKIMIGTPPDI